MSSFLESMDRRVAKAGAEAASIRARRLKARWGVLASWAAIALLGGGVVTYFVVAWNRASLPVGAALVGGFVILACALRTAARYFSSESLRLSEALREYDEFLRSARG